MSETPAATDWSAARGAKWRAHADRMEAQLAPVDEPLFDALALDGPSAIAEVGCGGGATALGLLRRAPEGSVVHGFDIAATLIELARERARSNEGATFDVADMTSAAPDRAYDRLVSRFGIMFFEDPAAAFSNLARWLVPGGRFAFAAWSRMADNPWMSAVRDVVARFVEVPPSDPAAPGPFRYGDSSALLSILERAGFAELSVRDWRGSLTIGGGLPAEEAARFAIDAFSSFGDLLATKGEGVRDEARRSLAAAYARHAGEGAVRMDACVHVFTGTVAGTRARS